MRLLHTSDWHIGRTLYGRKRYEEFESFLTWLAETIQQNEIEALLVAGDVFDTSAPSNRAQELYYRFLCRVAASSCRHVVVVAGNHDSPSFLNAPKELLKALNVHVVGSSTEFSEDEVLVLRNEQDAPELRRLETEFSAALAPVGFSNEEQFLAAILPSESRAELTATAKNLDERQTDLKARQKDRETRLTTEMARKITDKSLEELEPQFKEHEEALKELRDIIAGLKHKLSENTAAKERIKERQTAIEAQKKECRRWENLHELIGSADEKKYRNFAQGLTFEMMIGHANRQLQKMTDRYLLARDDAQPLELNVVDNYQAGEIRSTKNLSGGVLGYRPDDRGAAGC